MAHWNHLLPFVTVMREGSFRRAAGKLGITPAAMSQTIALFERRLGVRLFHRTTRRIQPTEEAQRLFDRVVKPVEELDRGLRALDDVSGEPAGVIRLWLGLAFGRQRVLPALTSFLAAYPKVTLEITFDGGAGSDRSGFDIAIHHRIESDEYVARKLRRMEMILVASPDYLARRGHPRTLAELNTHDHIVARGPDGTLLNWKPRTSHTVRPRSGTASGHPIVLNGSTPRVTLTGSYETVVDAALAGLGIAAILEDYVAGHLESGGLVRVLRKQRVQIGTAESSIVYLYYPNRAFLPRRSRLLIDHIIRELGSH